jgi:hypothetical protein
MTNIITRFQADPIEGNPLQVQVFYAKEITADEETILIPVNTPLVISEQSGGAIATAFTAFMAVLNEEINKVEPTPIIPKSDWGNFSRLMYSNPAYQRVRLATPNQNERLTLESLVIALGIAQKELSQQDHLFFQINWNQIINGLSKVDKPTALEIEDWSAIASATNMPFSFDSQGLIITNS